MYNTEKDVSASSIAVLYLIGYFFPPNYLIGHFPDCLQISQLVVLF